MHSGPALDYLAVSLPPLGSACPHPFLVTLAWLLLLDVFYFVLGEPLWWIIGARSFWACAEIVLFLSARTVAPPQESCLFALMWHATTVAGLVGDEACASRLSVMVFAPHLRTLMDLRMTALILLLI